MTVGWRRLPPGYSPLTGRTLGRALVALATGADARPRLAERLAQAYRADRVILTDGGTDALQLLLRRLAPEATPVALPAYSCYDLATAAAGANVPLVLYDVDPRTLAPDLLSLARALAAGARTVVVAPLYGTPIDWDLVTRAVAPWGATLIEDAAQGLGAEWKSRPLGSLGDASVLSFGRGKGWTGGSGGAALFRGPAARAASPGLPPDATGAHEWRGWLAAAGQWIFGRPALFALPAAVPALHVGETRYRTPGPVRPMRRSAAAIVAMSWDAVRAEVEDRRWAGARWRRALAGREGIEVVTPPAGSTPGELRLPILLERGGLDALRAPWARRLGLGPPYPGALAALPAVRARLMPWCLDRRWLGAEEIVRRLVTVPTHSLVTDPERGELLGELVHYAAGVRPSARSYSAA